MTIVGCDFHPGWQLVAVFDSETGEISEPKLENGNGEAERFYGWLPTPARVGFEACGNTQWFEDLLDGLGHEVWIGDGCRDSRPLGAPAEDGSSRRGPRPKAVARGSLPTFMATESSRARSSPVTDSSPSPGGDPKASEERVAAPEAKPGCATQAEAVERSRSEGITGVAAGGLGSAASTGFTEAAQRAEPTDYSAEPGGRVLRTSTRERACS